MNDGGMTYIDEWLLSLDCNTERRFGELDIQIPALVFAVYRYCYVDIFDCLGPFVGELGLFGFFFGLELRVGLFALLGGRRARHCDCVSCVFECFEKCLVWRGPFELCLAELKAASSPVLGPV